jgi:hypothetical protein
MEVAPQSHLKSVLSLPDEITVNLGLDVDLFGLLQGFADSAENYPNHFLAGYVAAHYTG